MGQIKVLVLGAEGMLGHKVAEHLSDFDLLAPSRAEFDVTVDSLARFGLSTKSYIVNCVGAIPQKNKSEDAMVQLNVNLPRTLATLPQRVIQIATDCVYSGNSGGYDELSEKDSLDIYGASKSVGEVQSANMMHIRSSIVGPEMKHKVSLFEWVRNQPYNSTVSGYANHLWNGVTTEAFAKVVRGILQNDLFSATTQHLVPANSVSKAKLVELIAERTGRQDIRVDYKDMPSPIDRTLTTVHKGRNKLLWTAGGYRQTPTVEEMIRGMSV